ncbi:MAG: M23 family metallopeptidase [Clostridia bacterium]|nr:M23 family metallopeptidase [Clostridia bacterium]
MDKENKKVNNDVQEKKVIKPKSLDEITDGFYDLNQLYAKAPAKKAKSREEELRLRDEKRRADEMKAIKEDIERRYSLQLETAQSKNNPEPEEPKPSALDKLMPEIDSRETVKEELKRIDSLIIGEPVPESEIKEEKKTEAKHKAKKKKTLKAAESEFDLSKKNGAYALVYLLGDKIYSFFARLFLFVFKIIKAPFIHLKRYIVKLMNGTKQGTKRSIDATINEIIHFRKEIYRAVKVIRRALKNPLSLPSVISHYVKKAIKKHRGLLKSAVNTLMPVAAFAIFLITINYWNSVTFALEVIYNDQSIGYISDESVYLEAKNLVKDRLSSSAYVLSNSETNIEATVASASNFTADYSLTLVSLDELKDAQAISDKMIENSVDNLTHACGIYIDGEFICAVKNEADAKTVFYDLLAPYEKDAEENGYVVGFAETIDYIQGLYRDDESVMWDASKLREMLDGTKEAQKVYVAQSGDSLDSIADETGMNKDDLIALNPDFDWDEIQPGDLIITKSSVKFVSIKKIVTSSEIRDIKHETVKKYDASKYSGYRRVIQKGVDGSERVIKTQIYINDVLTDTNYDYETIKKPVDEIITVGSKTSYNGVYIGEASDKGFLWPAPSCRRVSSPYGWRSSGWHNGIDLVRSGGGALGTPVIASKSGRVEVVQRSNSGYGNMVLINHGDGYKTRYAHMVKGSITVSVGDYVDAGQTIGKVGSTGNSTGPHLHFEVIVNGETRNPRNYIS